MRSRSTTKTAQNVEQQSSVMAIIFSAASGGPRLANSYPGGQQCLHCGSDARPRTGTQSAMTACSAVFSLSTLLVQCTVCEVVGASPQVNMPPTRADSRSSWPADIFNWRLASKSPNSQIKTPGIGIWYTHTNPS